MSLLVAALVVATKPVPGQVTISVAKIIEGLHPIAFAPAPFGSKFAATMEDGSVRIVDAKTRQTLKVLAKHPGPAYAVAWSPDGNFVATGDETARIWIENWASGKKVREYRTHTKGIQKLSYNLPGNLLISTGKDDQVNVYDLQSSKPKEIRSILGHGRNLYGATFHPKYPNTFAVGTLAGPASIYDAMSGRELGQLVNPAGQGVFDVAFNPAGNRIFCAGRDGMETGWDSKSCTRFATLRGHGDWVVSTVFSPNGKLIATSSSDRTVKVWNSTNFQKVSDLQSESPVGSPLCFTADGSTLVTVSDSGFLQFNDVSPSQALDILPTSTGTKAKAHRRRHRPA